MPDPKKITLTLTNATNVTVTMASADDGTPELQRRVMQIVKAGGVWADDGAFYPAPFLKITVE